MKNIASVSSSRPSVRSICRFTRVEKKSNLQLFRVSVSDHRIIDNLSRNAIAFLIAIHTSRADVMPDHLQSSAIMAACTCRDRTLHEILRLPVGFLHPSIAQYALSLSLVELRFLSHVSRQQLQMQSLDQETCRLKSATGRRI